MIYVKTVPLNLIHLFQYIHFSLFSITLLISLFVMDFVNLFAFFCVLYGDDEFRFTWLIWFIHLTELIYWMFLVVHGDDGFRVISLEFKLSN